MAAFTLAIDALTLRLATPADDDQLTRLFPDDADHDPTFARAEGTSLAEHRERWLRRTLESSRATRGRDSWTLPFVVAAGRAAIGLQWLEGEDFARTHTVDSTSWLVPGARRQGYGIAMRQAILALAFDRLGAARAISAARPTNAASIGVSTHLGYANLGETAPIVAGNPRPIVNFELTPDEWYAQPAPVVTIMGAPPWDEPLPGSDREPIWRNEAGALTHALDGHRYLKAGPDVAGFDPAATDERAAWVAGHGVATSRLRSWGREGGRTWSLSQGVPGWSAIDARWAGRETEIARELGRALASFHGALPVADCPWRWDVADRLQRLQPPLRKGFGDAPPVPAADRVVCHGDACNPNFLLDDDARYCGAVDLGALGIADRHADVAAALSSIGLNFADADARRRDFLAGYGRPLDPARLDFYGRLWGAE